MNSDRGPGQSRIINLRVAVPGDEGRVAALAYRTFAETYDDLTAGEVSRYAEAVLSAERFRAVLGRSDSRILLGVSADDHLLAYAQFEPTEPPAAVTCTSPVELVRLYVAREVQGRGLGTRLFQKGVAWARARGHGGLWLLAWDQAPRALAFYRGLGFRVVGNEPYRAGGLDDRVHILSLELDQDGNADEGQAAGYFPSRPGGS